MCTIQIIYHSQTGNTQKMAECAAKGAGSIAGVTVILKKADEATLQDLLVCNGLIIGTPEYFGYMSGIIKDFFDRTYAQARDKNQVSKKPYAVFISAGNDGTGALNSIERICTGFQFKKTCSPLIAKGAIDNAIAAKCEELGATIAAGCKEKIY